MEGRHVDGLDELNTQLRIWLAEVANRRRHRTTGERPVDRLAADLAAMLPVAGIEPYAGADPARDRALEVAAERVRARGDAELQPHRLPVLLIARCWWKPRLRPAERGDAEGGVTVLERLSNCWEVRTIRVSAIHGLVEAGPRTL